MQKELSAPQEAVQEFGEDSPELNESVPQLPKKVPEAQEKLPEPEVNLQKLESIEKPDTPDSNLSDASAINDQAPQYSFDLPTDENNNADSQNTNNPPILSFDFRKEPKTPPKDVQSSQDDDLMELLPAPSKNDSFLTVEVTDIWPKNKDTSTLDDTKKEASPINVFGEEETDVKTLTDLFNTFPLSSPEHEASGDLVKNASKNIGKKTSEQPEKPRRLSRNILDLRVPNRNVQSAAVQKQLQQALPSFEYFKLRKVVGGYNFNQLEAAGSAETTPQTTNAPSPTANNTRDVINKLTDYPSANHTLKSNPPLPKQFQHANTLDNKFTKLSIPTHGAAIKGIPVPGKGYYVNRQQYSPPRFNPRQYGYSSPSTRMGRNFGSQGKVMQLYPQ